MDIKTESILMFDNNNGTWKFEDRCIGSIQTKIDYDITISRFNIEYYNYNGRDHGESILASCIRDYKTKNGIK